MPTSNLAYNTVFNVVGVNHKTLPLEERERLALLGMGPEFDLKRIASEAGLEEAALLSTCNRFEIIAAGSDAEARLVDFLKSELGKPANEGVYCLRNAEAVRHIFRVASSLDSMVVGEAQILGQVKDCYRRAVDHGLAGRNLHHLFQFSFRLAKKVRENTKISERGVSISYIAVRLAQQIFGDIATSKVLLIGSGKMAELAALHLESYGCRQILVANRTLERASELAGRFSGSAISLGDVAQHLRDVDIVISSISIDRPILDTAQVRGLKRARPLFLIDLGVPRNFQPNLGELENVYLYNIDDLGAIADENRALREEAAREAELIVEYGLHQFERWLLKTSAQPRVLDFRGRVREICEAEIDRALGRHLTPEKVADVSSGLSYKISQKISHDLTEILSSSLDGKLEPSTLLPFVFDDILKVL